MEQKQRKKRKKPTKQSKVYIWQIGALPKTPALCHCILADFAEKWLVPHLLIFLRNRVCALFPCHTLAYPSTWAGELALNKNRSSSAKINVAIHFLMRLHWESGPYRGPYRGHIGGHVGSQGATLKLGCDKELSQFIEPSLIYYHIYWVRFTSETVSIFLLLSQKKIIGEFF